MVRLHLSEYLKTYLMGIAVLFGIWIIMLAPSTVRTTHFNESVYRLHGILFSFIFGGAGAWFASEAFRVVSTPVRGIPYLMLPASQLEKYLLSLLMLLLFIPVFIGVFYTVESVCFAVMNSRLPLAEPRYQLLDLGGAYIPFDLRYLSWAAPSLFLLGSIYFPNLPVVKTSIVAFLLYFFIIFLNEVFIRQVFPTREHYGSTPFAEVFFWQNERRYGLELTGVARQLIYATLLLLVPALWFTAYVRFKEKEL